ncbi:MAG: hypothetical protein L0229_09800 [Blastocatellia bacterium]|nr:hypothetical protein [Blastocatellia bacterium]
MRITGLVRFFNHVRSRLQAGLKPDEVETFKKQVQGIVRDVEEMCRASGVTPDHLPGPSRRAYLFLKEIDLDNLPVAADDATVASATSFRIKNVVKVGDYFADKLWRQLITLVDSSAARAQLKREMDGQISAIERICAKYDTTPSTLEAPSKRVYCWLKFLWSGENLTSHLEALQRARDALREYQPHIARRVDMHLISMNALWRKRQYRNAVLFKVNEGFLSADATVWRAIVHIAAQERERARDRLISDFAESDDFSEVLFEMESFASSPTGSARGHAHDLDESFDRVNRAYFGGQMPRPGLVWNRTLTARKFGHYQPSRDTLMISVSLDDPLVPACVVDFVMYHELLHKKHGVTTVGGRQLAHSPGFRADERRFADYTEAKRRLDEIAFRQRGLSVLTMAADPDDDDD